jgi:hypothetical protein
VPPTQNIDRLRGRNHEAPDPRFTSTGLTRYSAVLPMPSWPLKLKPQHLIPPAVTRIHVWSLPKATAVAETPDMSPCERVGDPGGHSDDGVWTTRERGERRGRSYKGAGVRASEGDGDSPGRGGIRVRDTGGGGCLCALMPVFFCSFIHVPRPSPPDTG